MTIRVLVVDDSRLIRAVLSDILNSDPDIEVVGTAEDAFAARHLIKTQNPDVLTLDIEMPGMSGLELLGKIVRLRPMPVVMISSLTRENTRETLEALELGAVDFVPKPASTYEGGLVGSAERIIEAVKCAAGARVRTLDLERVRKIHAAYQPPADWPVSSGQVRGGHVLAIGASTGGVEAIAEVLMHMPVDCPPIVITQHIPPVFSTSYAARLNKECPIRVYEAQSGQELERGSAYIAPGSHHLLLHRDGVKRVCRLSDAEPVNRHRPSVEVMFDSVRAMQGVNCTAALLTGMGADGAEALLRMRMEGIHTIAQNEATCVVWGMPAEAVRLGAAVEILPLEQIAAALMRAAMKPAPSRGA